MDTNLESEPKGGSKLDTSTMSSNTSALGKNDYRNRKKKPKMKWQPKGDEPSSQGQQPSQKEAMLTINSKEFHPTAVPDIAEAPQGRGRGRGGRGKKGEGRGQNQRGPRNNGRSDNLDGEGNLIQVSQSQDFPAKEGQKPQREQNCRKRNRKDDFAKEETKEEPNSKNTPNSANFKFEDLDKEMGIDQRQSTRGGRGRGRPNQPRDQKDQGERPHKREPREPRRGGGGDRRGGRPQTAFPPQSDKMEAWEERGQGQRQRQKRGGGKLHVGRQDGQNQDFFERRKLEKQQFEESQEAVGTGNNRELQKFFKSDENEIQGRSQKMKSKMFLGSTRAALGDEGGSENPSKKTEKLVIVQRKEKKVSKDKVSVKYNFQDFLNQNHNLTDQCKHFVETLSQGTQECSICSNPIYQRSAVWNCKQCCQPFHLGCISRWIRRLNADKDDMVDDDREEEKVPERSRDMMEELEEAADDVAEREIRKASKQLLAFYSWTCPNCNYSYAENTLPRYKCFCGRYEEPAFSPLILAHSCGEHCDKKKNEHCTHDRCDSLCHPGSCPPCGITVPVTCHCGKETTRVPCHALKKSKFSCSSTCGKLLNCMVHECQEACHEGPCKPCDVKVQQKCFCGKEEYESVCGLKQRQCQQICGKSLDCGKHTCEKKCHQGDCGPCPKDPSRLKYCPCGHNTIESLIGRQRRTCTDPVPKCSHECERFLPCGLHQCKKKCHTDDCEICEQPVEQACRCGKEYRMVPCFVKNYSEEKRKEILEKQEVSEEIKELLKEYTCTRICNKTKKCKKHKCRVVCCGVQKGGPDPTGAHMCLMTCNKTLSCGKHQCNDFCHIGPCKPCRVYSREPLFCPCGIAKIEPPIKCGTIPPTCNGPCLKEHECGHKCAIGCHLGQCPPCMEKVTKTCVCGKETYENIYCHKRKPNCGQQCGFPLKCGHICQKECHAKGQCFTTVEDLMENGCGQRCQKQRDNCMHRCQSMCHPGKPCPEVPCDAEMRHYCSCGNRYIITICKSIQDRKPLECNTECWKLQRNQRLANAFGTTKDYEENKLGIKIEYYPNSQLEFAIKFPKFAVKVETYLTDVVLQKASRSFMNLTGDKRAFLQMYVYEHFKLEMCTYGGKGGSTSVTDVTWKEGCRVPEILATEVVDLIEKGIITGDLDENRKLMFEASIFVSSLPKGSTIDDLKKLLRHFQNEFYAEPRGGSLGQPRSAALHFYNGARARDAFSFIKSNPHQFSEVKFMCHRKQVGTADENEEEKKSNADSDDSDYQSSKKPQYDDEGFEIVKKK